ncbi:MAG: hypothetical protein R3178_11530 [Rhodothermales bacterium]|nr:hypothetical protein [Rhodothermales bacterium]
MRVLTLQFSVLTGILTFVSQITSGMALDSSLLRGLATASAIFFVMLVGDLAIQAVVRSQPPVEPSGRRGIQKHTSDDRPDALAA